MTRKLGILAAIAALSGSLSIANVAPAGANPPPPSGECVDHSDQGGGNGGDPGDGQEHHNESNGVGNNGDPGNGQGHFCENE
jgi:hypothetical protein